MTETTCTHPIPPERLVMGFRECVRCSIEERRVGLLSFSGKTGGELVVGSRASIHKLIRNDRRRDGRLLRNVR